MRIFVIDDDKEFADSMAMLMEVWGHEVSVAYSAIDGMVLSRQCEPDVILHDIAMPNMSGYGAVKQLRTQPRSRPLLIVAVTAHDDVADRNRAQKAGFDALMGKPVDLKLLDSMLKAHQARLAGAC